MSNKRVFITGGHGFLGKKVLAELQDKCDFYAPTHSEVNVLDNYELYSAIDWYQPTSILHMSANCGGIKKNADRPADLLWDNSAMAINVYHAAMSCNVKKVYSLGSVCMYGKNCPIPFKEDDMLLESPDPSNAPYGNSKRLLMSLSESFRKQYGIGGAFLVPVNLYGIDDDFNLETCHVVPALIRRFIEAKQSNAPSVSLFGNGTHTRELLFAQDCAEAIANAVLSDFDYPAPINLGTGKSISIKELAELVRTLVGYDGEILFSNNGLDGQPKRQLDVSRAKELLGWEAKTSLVDGLKKTIEWYMENAHV